MITQPSERTKLVAALRRVAALESVSMLELRSITRQVFTFCGLAPEDADIAAEVATYPQSRGSDSHGLATMALYVIGLVDGTIKSAPKIDVKTTLPTCAVMDADNGLGLVVSHRAIDIAIERAEKFGLGAVAVRNSSHFGVAGYYVERAARRGLIGLSMSNAAPAIAPTGGKTPLLGTNPIGGGFPMGVGDPMIADMATAMVARSKIKQALAAGEESIPEGWAFDSDGRPTRSPAAAVEGSMAPIGGAKGYGLALMVELLCSALSDGPPGFDVTYENVTKRPSGISHFFIVINPAGFAGAERYGARAAHIARVIETSDAAADGAAPRLPGARGLAIDRASEASGIVMQPNLRVALNAVAKILEQRV